MAHEMLPLGNLPFHILLALGDGPLHGYAIGREIETRSAGKLNPTTGSLYQALRRLTEDGLIEPAPAADSMAADRRRQHFQLTRLGRRLAGLEAERLAGLVEIARERRLFPGSR